MGRSTGTCRSRWRTASWLRWRTVFRPVADGTYPVLITYGPYGKGLHFEDLYTQQWRLMCELAFPTCPQAPPNKYQNWEVVDPEKWGGGCPDGYVCVRVGQPRRGPVPPGLLRHLVAARGGGFQAVQSTGPACSPGPTAKGWGINGISYYAMNAWKTASLQPKHLSAKSAPGKGPRISTRGHGLSRRHPVQTAFHDNLVSQPGVYSVQHGKGPRTRFRSRYTRRLWSRARRRCRKEGDSARIAATSMPTVAGQFRSTPRITGSRGCPTGPRSRSRVILFPPATGGGQGLHPRGNFEGFGDARPPKRSGSRVHGREHWTEFYTDYGVALQKKFFRATS